MTRTIYASSRWRLIVSNAAVDQAVCLNGSSSGVAAIAVLAPQGTLSPLPPGPEVHGSGINATVWLTVPAGASAWVRMLPDGATGTLTFAQSFVTTAFLAQLSEL